MSKHTPGPWRYREGMIYAEDGDGATIATVRDLGNGDLIAAAPELLAALEPSYLREVADSIRGVSESFDSYAYHLELLADAQDAAIRKATGER